MNDINFTGLQNMGACACSMVSEKGKRVGSFLLVNLKADARGKYLSEYENVLGRCSNSFYNKFPDDKNFLHIQTLTSLPANKEGKVIPQLVVNGHVVPTKTETMPLFTYVARLTKRILGMSEKEFKIAEDFKYGPDGDSYLTRDVKFSELDLTPEQRKLLIDEVYSLNSVKTSAKFINDDIQAQMMDYFA